ncbi:rhoGEF domain-containing protein [Naegleria gruberi]|uniref:RhoGEF domain-containing protein n=1 Tax=Naegleria gruberi TaxID=5762 RepID=D2W0R9_NAEGR|nr:rhoGEF domain-containing protein [Naegleria gruberi]EFC37339.1 rhoGEF domain-containing protein [Naegleria gruberi]|eukprot:XP_002670083.1 rhoGEF domain-containing protein [Naegleria gruberi strain NEG-M]
MSVKAGDVVEVVKRYKDGWSWCYLKSRSTGTFPTDSPYGMIPTAYLTEIEDSPEATSSIEPTSTSQSFTDSSKNNNLELTTSFVISKNIHANAEPKQTHIFQDEDFNQVMTEQSDNLSVASYRTDCTDLSIGGERRSKKKELLSKIGSFFRKSKKNENSSVETPKTPRFIIKHESFKTSSSIITEEKIEKVEKIEKTKISNVINPTFPIDVLNDVKKKVITKTETTKRESISFNLFSRQKRSKRHNHHQATATDHMQFIAEKLKHLHRRKAMQHYLKTETRFKKAKKRLELIKETIDTERTYVNLLKAFIDIFYYPIVNDSGHGKGILKKEVYNTLFSNIEQIYKINNTLLHDWENEYNTNYPFVNIGKAFSQISPFLKAYTIYINNFDKAQEMFEKLREKDKRFKEYLTECYKNKLVKGTLLGGFLILPVQRIPRYKLLIQEMLKNTPPTHHEYEILQKCAKEIESIAAFVNDEKRNVEQNQTVFEVQNMVQKQYPQFVQPNRKFIKKGSMKIKITIHRIEEQLDNRRGATSSNHSSLNSTQDSNLSCLMTCREAKFDVYLFTDVLVLIEMEKNKSMILTDEKVHFVFLQFVDCRDFVRISQNGRSRNFIESPDSLLSNHNSKRSSLQWDDNIFKRIEHEDFSFVIEALFKGVKTEYSFMTSNLNEKKAWMKSIRDCLEGLSRGNISKGIEQDIYLIGKERISLNKIAKCKLEEHQSLEKGCLLKVSYLTQLEQHLNKKKQQLTKLQKEIEIYNLDRDQVMLEAKTLQEKKSKIREDLKFYYLSIQERDQTMMKLLNEDQSFKLIFDDVPTVDSETVYKM